MCTLDTGVSSDYTLTWYDPNGNVLGTGANCVATMPGTYRCVVTTELTSGGDFNTSKGACNFVTCLVSYAGTYRFL